MRSENDAPQGTTTGSTIVAPETSKAADAKQEKASPPAPARPKPSAKPAASPKRVAAGAEKESTVKTTTKKSAPKKTSKAKSTARRSPAKKTAARSKARSGVAKPRGFEETSVISVKLKENPRRKGSKAYARLEKLLKAGGKTVKAFLSGGGQTGTLRNAVNKKWATVSK